MLPASISLFNIHGQVYDPLGSPWVADFGVSPAEPGTRSGTAESGNVTLAISWRAGLAGRAYRGRIYFPGLVEPDVNANDTIGTAAVAGLAAVGAAFLLNYNAPTGIGQLVLFHRNDNLFSTVVSIVLEALVDSQRRRLAGRGR